MKNSAQKIKTIAGVLIAIFAIFLLSPADVYSQEKKEERKVKVKMIKNHNGEERVVDTVIDLSTVEDIEKALESLEEDFPGVNVNIQKIISEAEEGEEMTIDIDVDIDDSTFHNNIRKKMIILREELDVDMEELKENLKEIEANLKIEIENADSIANHAVRMSRINADSLKDAIFLSLEAIKDIDFDSLPDDIDLDWIEMDGDEEVQVIKNKSGDGGMTVIIKTGSKEGEDEEKYKVLIDEMKKDDFKKTGLKASKSSSELEPTGFEFYPNPGDGEFRLKFELDADHPTTISVFDANGNKVYNESVNPFTGTYDNTIDISREKKGIYFLHIVHGKKQMNRKIVVK